MQTKLNEAGDRLTIICFFASWCGACKMIKPQVEKLATEFSTVSILKLEVDECDDIVKEYNILCVPTFIFIKGKQIVHTLSGANFDKLKDAILDCK